MIPIISYFLSCYLSLPAKLINHLVSTLLVEEVLRSLSCL